MKKILVSLFAISLCIYSSAQTQTCEQREDALLTALGSVSAGFIYNTYSTIGSVSDGFVHKTYDQENAQSIATEQVTLIESIRKSMQDLVDKKMLKDADDIRYIRDLNDILDGLKNQANLLQSYIKNSSTSTADAFDVQRKANWKKIAKLMGIDK